MIEERAHTAALQSDVDHVQNENMALAEKLAIITSKYEELMGKYKKQRYENTMKEANRTHSARNTTKIVTRSRSRKRTRDKSATRVKSVKRI